MSLRRVQTNGRFKRRFLPFVRLTPGVCKRCDEYLWVCQKGHFSDSGLVTDPKGLMRGQSAAHEQGGPDERPDSHARLAHDGHRHARSDAKAEQLGNESRPGFANADLKGYKFEGHGNQAVEI